MSDTPPHLPLEDEPLTYWHPALWLSTWFGVGYLKPAPGTFGSLAALPLAWGVFWLTGSTAAIYLSACLLFLLGVWATAVYQHRTGKMDPKEVVIDEVAGQMLLLAGLPQTVTAYVAGFILFRLFDVLKPWPVSYFDRRVKNAFGVMMDDICAGLYPFVLFWLLMMVDIASGGSLQLMNVLDWLREASPPGLPK